MNIRGFLTAAWWQRRRRQIGAVVAGPVTTGLAWWRRYRRGIAAVGAGLVSGAFIGVCFAVMRFLGFVADLGARYGNYGLGEMVKTVQVIGFDLLGFYATANACVGAFCGFIGAVGYRALVHWAGEPGTTAAQRSTFTVGVSTLIGLLLVGVVFGVFLGVSIGFFGTVATIPSPVITLTCLIGGYLAAMQVSRR